jgi:hypothetical protein
LTGYQRPGRTRGAERPDRQALSSRNVESSQEFVKAMEYTYEQLAKMIDHSLLNPVMTDEDL